MAEPLKCHAKPDQKVVVMMTDMTGYARRTSTMSPDELRDFIGDYYHHLHELVSRADNEPLEIEPSGGDGALILFKKNDGDSDGTICTRAVKTALRISRAMAQNRLAPTRVGIFLGRVIEAELFGRTAKFSTIFAVANRLEELCGYFGINSLMDREVAREMRGETPYLVSIGKFSLASASHPLNAYTLYKPGVNGCPDNVDPGLLRDFIHTKNEAMDYFSGNLLSGLLPDFPAVRTRLVAAQALFRQMTGREDQPIFRILDYIRQFPFPDSGFSSRGMLLTEKKRDTLGDRLYYLPKQLLKAMDHDLFHTLVKDTSWEQLFKLEWHRKGSSALSMTGTSRSRPSRRVKFSAKWPTSATSREERQPLSPTATWCSGRYPPRISGVNRRSSTYSDVSPQQENTSCPPTAAATTRSQNDETHYPYPLPALPDHPAAVRLRFRHPEP